MAKVQGVPSVVIYTTKTCPYCVRAKALFSRKGVEFLEVDVSEDNDKRRWLAQTTGQRTVPQIFINDRSVGGFEDVWALDRRGELDRLLRSPVIQ
jgi:glutaredoxin 3